MFSVIYMAQKSNSKLDIKIYKALAAILKILSKMTKMHRNAWRVADIFHTFADCIITR